MTTQLQRYQALLEALDGPNDLEAIQGAWTCLQYLSDQSQNPPPEGFADGSIGDLTWSQLRSLQDSLGRYLRELNTARKTS